MSEPQKTRLSVIAEGVLLMAGCAIVVLTGTEWVANLGLDGYRLGRGWLLFVFAPVTAISILVSAILWTRRRRVSMREFLGSLTAAELLAWGVVASLNGAWFGPFMFMFWAIANLLFTPWWS